VNTEEVQWLITILQNSSPACKLPNHQCSLGGVAAVNALACTIKFAIGV